MIGPRKLDGWGLHAVDCPCAQCELGNRPTALERDAARRAALDRGQKGARVKREQERVEKAKASLAVFSEHMEAMREHKPLTPEQFAELQEEWRKGTWKK
jgi:hypothetical protein